jgi:hypothetical protein
MLADKLNCLKVEFEPTTEVVRKMISTIYNIKEPCVYWCEDLDTMHVNAKNSLLKVTEETPKNAYIVLHCTSNTLGTLVSRSRVLTFESYTLEDYEQYCGIQNLQMPENSEILMQCCNSLNEFSYYVQTEKFIDAYLLANKVLEYISVVSVVNAFKILKSLALKKDEEGIEPDFFLKVLINVYIQKLGKVEFGDIILKSSQVALQLLSNNVLSKQAIMDKWILEMVRGIDAIC